MTPTAPVDYEQVLPEVMRAFLKTHELIAAHDVDRRLQHLILLRASQINGCAFCVTMHAREAREDGETDDRLDRLAVWRHVSDYAPAEKAAFAWTEALTRPEEATDYGALRAELRQYYSETQIGALTGLVCMINLWNRLAISRH